MKKLELSKHDHAELTDLYERGDYSKFNQRVAALSGKIKIGVVLDELLGAGQRLNAYKAKYNNNLEKMHAALETDPFATARKP